MKGHHEHHHRKHRSTGGLNEEAEDLKTRNQRYTYESKVNKEAEERKHGGRTKRKHGGHVEHHEERKAHHHKEHVKHVGHVEGEHAKHHAGRKPRKSGGRASSDANPYTSARHGTPPPGRKLDMEME
jgi:hypothetical protein